jgi:hypothetical protein
LRLISEYIAFISHARRHQSELSNDFLSSRGGLERNLSVELIEDCVLTRQGMNEEEPNSWERLNADRDHVLETVQAENRVQKPQDDLGHRRSQRPQHPE